VNQHEQLLRDWEESLRQLRLSLEMSRAMLSALQINADSLERCVKAAETCLSRFGTLVSESSRTAREEMSSDTSGQVGTKGTRELKRDTASIVNASMAQPPAPTSKASIPKDAGVAALRNIFQAPSNLDVQTTRMLAETHYWSDLDQMWIPHNN